MNFVENNMDTRNDVADFMRAGKHDVHAELQPFNQQAMMYFDLVREEYYELYCAIKNMDIVETADACADLIWVIEGLCHSLGIPLQKVWDEVNRSNMSKLIEGNLVKREDGKILKPDTYSPPDIKSILK
jgi:predicted HAD superfamily Cof-like phosphohydrolase